MPCSERLIALVVVVGFPPATVAGTVSTNSRLICAVLRAAVAGRYWMVNEILWLGVRVTGGEAVKLAVNAVEPITIG